MNKVFHIVYCIAVTAILTSQYQPSYNWDILPYMAMITDDDNAEATHKKVYDLLKAEEEQGNISRGTFDRLINRTTYRQDMYADAELFHDQLVYYKTKPLYNSFNKLLTRLGAPIHKAPFIPSLIGVIIMMIIFYIWLIEYVQEYLALATGIVLIFILPGITELLNMASPDGLSNMLVLLMFCLFAAKANQWLLISTMVLAVLCRIDNFIPVLIITIFSIPRKNLVQLLIATIFITAFAILLPLLSGNQFNWFLKFKYLESHVQYYFHVRNLFRELADYKYLLFIALGLMILLVGTKNAKRITLAVLLSIVVRLILFPSMQERFFVAYELIVITMLFASLQKTNTGLISRYLVKQSKRISSFN